MKNKNNSRDIKKARAVIEEIIRKEAFQKKVLAIREHYNIPIANQSEHLGIHSWVNYRYQNPQLSDFDFATQFANMIKDIELLAHEFNLDVRNYEVLQNLIGYIFDNKILYLDTEDPASVCRLIYRFEEHVGEAEMVLCENSLTLPGTSEKEKEFNKKRIDSWFQNRSADYRVFPISILISPTASINSIKSFISRNKKKLEEMQAKFLPPNSKDIRSKRNAERDDFIYKHRNMPYKKLVRLVCSEFPKELTRSIDEGSIGKIISLETKRRK